MRLFDLPQARHFCAGVASAPAGSRQSLPHFHATARGGTLLTEGSKAFEVHQVNVLASVERWLVYALGNYRRTFDMLVPVSAPWAQVTLYYSSFFAANAVLGMFGGWIGQLQAQTCVIDVEGGVVGHQRLKIHRGFRSPSGARGSHRVFWAEFYDATASISAWAPAELVSAFTPVNNDFAWQINERNNVNYDMFHAWGSSMRFFETFKPAKLHSLSGPARLQLETTEQIVRIALHFAREVALPGAGLDGCGAAGNRLQSQKQLVTRTVPSLLSQSTLSTLLET